MITADELWPKLDVAGEEEVRKQLAMGAFAQQKIPLVKEWLARRERQRGDAMNQDRDAREDEALKLSAEANSIAREGNAISRRSSLAAWVAVAISVVALLVAIASAVIEARKPTRGASDLAPLSVGAVERNRPLRLGTRESSVQAANRKDQTAFATSDSRRNPRVPTLACQQS